MSCSNYCWTHAKLQKTAQNKRYLLSAKRSAILTSKCRMDLGTGLICQSVFDHLFVTLLNVEGCRGARPAFAARDHTVLQPVSALVHCASCYWSQGMLI